jgi:hypothetical protein
VSGDKHYKICSNHVMQPNARRAGSDDYLENNDVMFPRAALKFERFGA